MWFQDQRVAMRWIQAEWANRNCAACQVIAQPRFDRWQPAIRHRSATLLPAALEHNVGILVSKYTVNSESPEGDFRKNDFAGDRLVEQLNQRYDGSEPNRRR